MKAAMEEVIASGGIKKGFVYLVIAESEPLGAYLTREEARVAKRETGLGAGAKIIQYKAFRHVR